MVARMRRVVAAVLLLAVGCASPTTAEPPPQVVAHRGASVDAPENTLAAIRLAARRGADRVEVDVRRSRDGRMVLMHDGSARRTTDVEAVYPRRRPWRVAELSLPQLRALDAGSWHSRRYAGEAVPTLAEAVGLGEPLLVEVKTPVDAAQLSRLLRGADVVVQSFDHRWARRFGTRAARTPLMLLLRERPTDGELAGWSAWSEGVAVRAEAIDRDLVDAAHGHGLVVFAWTVDRHDEAQRLAGAGVDGIITNRPAAIGAAVARR